MFPILDLLIVGLVVIALSGLRVAQEYERGVVFRLGRYKALRARTVSAEQQETITRDSVTIAALSCGGCK
jgi:hypothetical protein